MGNQGDQMLSEFEAKKINDEAIRRDGIDDALIARRVGSKVREMKKHITSTLRELGFIDDLFYGEIKLVVKAGGVTNFEVSKNYR